MERLEQAPSAHTPRSRHISVAVRLRPPPASGRRRAKSCLSPAGSGAAWSADRAEPGGLVDRKTGEVWYFDTVCEPEATTCELYEACVREIVDSFCEGFNGTIFTYGQTASGKTFTMQGDGQVDGVAQLAVQSICAHILSKPDHQYLVSASYLEVFNEKVFDLLSADCAEVDVLVDQHNRTARYLGSGPEDILLCLADGDRRRHKCQTHENQNSSMSHVILQIEMESRQPRADGECGIVLQSTLNLVDLASSERMTRDRSLSSLAEAVTALVDQQRGARCFRSSQMCCRLRPGGAEPAMSEFGDSKLLSILDKSLGGNSQTVILCAISPAHADYTETRRVLEFAGRARCVQNKVSANIYDESQSLIHQMDVTISKAEAELAVLQPPALLPNKSLQAMREQLELRRRREELESTIKMHRTLISQAMRFGSAPKLAEASPAAEAARAVVAGAAVVMPASQKRPRARPPARAASTTGSCELLESAEGLREAKEAASPQSHCSSPGGGGSDAPAAPRKRRRPASVSSASCGQRAGSCAASLAPDAASARLQSANLRSASAGPATAVSPPPGAPAAADPTAAPPLRSAPTHRLVAELVRRLRAGLGGAAAPAAEVAAAEPRDLLPLAEEAHSLLSVALGGAAAAARPGSHPLASSAIVASPPASPRSSSPGDHLTQEDLAAEPFQQQVPPPLPLPAPEAWPEARELRAHLDAQELQQEELVEALERTRQEFAEAKLQAETATEEASYAVELAEVHRTWREAQQEELAASVHFVSEKVRGDFAVAEHLGGAGGLPAAQEHTLAQGSIAAVGEASPGTEGHRAAQEAVAQGIAAADDGSDGAGLVASRRRSGYRCSVGTSGTRTAAPEGFMYYDEDHFQRTGQGERICPYGQQTVEGERRSGTMGEVLCSSAAEERSRQELVRAEKAAALLQAEHREAEERARLEALAVSQAERAQRQKQPHQAPAQRQAPAQCQSQQHGRGLAQGTTQGLAQGQQARGNGAAEGHGEGQAKQPAPRGDQRRGQAPRPAGVGPALRRPFGARDRDGCQQQ